MASRSIPQRVRNAVRSGRYRLTTHAEQEREADGIRMREVEEAFGSDSLEVIEDYPADPRGHSALLLGFTASAEPLHAVVGLGHPDVIVFVTLYRPDPSLWDDWRSRVVEP